jgi:hypothetical protein
MTRGHSTDPFDPANFVFAKEYFETGRAAGNGNTTARVRQHGSRPKYQKCVFPLTLLDALIEHRANWTVLATVVALHELWFTHPNHNNPVHFTTYNLRRFGLSRQQKWRALRFLESIGQISIQRMGPGKNPMVTLNWERVAK